MQSTWSNILETKVIKKKNEKYYIQKKWGDTYEEFNIY